MEGNNGSEEERKRCCLNGFMDLESEESHRFYLSRRTVLEMLRDRGYHVPPSDINLSLEEFRSIYGSDPDIDRLNKCVSHRTDPSKRVQVMFCGTDTVKVDVIRTIVNQFRGSETISGLILILQSKITSQALKAVDLFSYKIEIFQITDLLVNITQHESMPKHQVLSEQDKQGLLNKYSITENQLPVLSKSDAISRYYGLEKGQVVKVTYDGELTKSHVIYRCVR